MRSPNERAGGPTNGPEGSGCPSTPPVARYDAKQAPVVFAAQKRSRGLVPPPFSKPDSFLQQTTQERKRYGFQVSSTLPTKSRMNMT